MAEEGLPWHLGVFDAHCHPTDTMSSLAEIPSMKARILTVMATRAQDQDLVDKAALDMAASSIEELDLDSTQRPISHKNPLLIGVHANSNKPTKIIPSFGWHPWFSHQLYTAEVFPMTEAPLTGPQKTQHYRSVLNPPPSDTFIETLPDPRPLSAFTSSLRKQLHAHPLALVGEVGLDRGFRLPEAWGPEDSRSDEGLTPGGREGRRLTPHKVALEHQREVLLAQLGAAAELGRAASVHGVQAPGVLYEALASTWRGHEREVPGRKQRMMARREREARAGEADGEEEQGERKGGTPFPPRICLHSYSGPPETVKQYTHPSVPVDVFFSFSTAINFGNDSVKAEAAIKAVPEDRLLVESDLHIAGQRMDEMLEDIVRRICALKGWGLEQGVKQLGQNWRRFVFGIE